MPLAPPAVALVLASNLASTGHLGFALPAFAQAVATGVASWAAKATVQVVGVGAAGTGVATLPLTVPQPLLLTSLQTGFASAGLTGFFSPMTVLGLANGFASALPSGIMLATVVGVGLGAGVARISSPPAVTDFQAGFAALGMGGTSTGQIALALGLAFDMTFAAFSIPIPIVGPAGPAPGSGTGVGKIT